ncbi:MAG: hydrogenase maturation nickel metallochaperone HypA [Dehalococcoidia bacterium]|nr:hydrogenase maturation nickel metallochaperone HypA [Dehalococcoidia bacterium]
MHEMAIAHSLIKIAIAAAEKEGARRITKVNVVAGELRGIVPMQFTFCFGLMAENTIASGARLDLEITPVTARCRNCEETFIVEDYRYVCPKCQGEDVQTVGGTELRLRDIEVE